MMSDKRMGNGVLALLVVGTLGVACGAQTPVVVPPPPLPPSSTPTLSSSTDAATAGAASASLPLTNDEGMWLLNDFPADRRENGNLRSRPGRIFCQCFGIVDAKDAESVFAGLQISLCLSAC